MKRILFLPLCACMLLASNTTLPRSLTMDFAKRAAKTVANNSWRYTRWSGKQMLKNIAFGPFGLLAGLYLGLKASHFFNIDIIGYIGRELARSRVAGDLKKKYITRPTNLTGDIVTNENIRAVVENINRARPGQQADSPLFWGVPGCGKTQLAYQIAYETECPMIEIASGGIDPNNGGAQTIQAIFDAATKVPWYKKCAQKVLGRIGLGNRLQQKPTIIFFDEIERIASARDGFGAEHGMRNVLLTQFNHGPDDDPQKHNFVVIGATNTAPDQLDGAITRRGRIGTHINIIKPNQVDREQILHHYAERQPENRPIADDIDFAQLAVMTHDFSGADLESLFAGAAARDDNNTVRQALLEEVINGMVAQRAARGRLGGGPGGIDMGRAMGMARPFGGY